MLLLFITAQTFACDFLFNVSQSCVYILAIVQVIRSCKPVGGFNFILVSNFHIAQILEAESLHITFLCRSFTYGRSHPNFRNRSTEVPHIKYT